MDKKPSFSRRVTEHILARALSASMSLKGIEHGKGCRAVHRLPDLQNDGRMSIGHDVVFRSKNGRVSITADPGAEVSIGAAAYINSLTVIHAWRQISIGSCCRIGEMCFISDTNFHEIEEGQGAIVKPVTLGRNVWLGRGVVVLPGVTIGDHAVVGAGSVVTKDVPARALATGVPAQIVRSLRASDTYIRP
jgi:acetyltransferase-like isoleucine patch superfamily enzyme